MAYLCFIKMVTIHLAPAATFGWSVMTMLRRLRPRTSYLFSVVLLHHTRQFFVVVIIVEGGGRSFHRWRKKAAERTATSIDPVLSSSVCLLSLIDDKEHRYGVGVDDGRWGWRGGK